MQKNWMLAGLLVVASSGCASIDGSHIGLSEGIEQGVAHQELKYMKLVDRYEKDARDWVNARMLYIDGPQIMKRAIKKTNFNKEIGKNKCALEQAHDLLEFTLDASASFERRKAKKMGPLDDFFFGLRSKAREEYGLLRQAASTLTTGLRAYVKGKDRRKDVLRSLNVPVDGVDALNKAALKFDKKAKNILDMGGE